jgi:hypothetical protein
MSYAGVSKVADGTPEPPGTDVPSGHIWPPIEGRILLSAAIEAKPTLSNVQGSWRASTDGGWCFHTNAHDLFLDAEDGRRYLVQMARAHLAHAKVLSDPRCLVLAPDGAGAWRLWQVVKERMSLRERLSVHLDETDIERLILLLLDTANRMLDLETRIDSTGKGRLRVTLDSVGIFAGTTQFVGTLGEAQVEPRGKCDLMSEFRPVLSDWRPRRDDLAKGLEAAKEQASPSERAVLDLLALAMEDEGTAPGN